MLTEVALSGTRRHRRPPFTLSSCLRGRSPAPEVGRPLKLSPHLRLSGFIRDFPAFLFFSSASVTNLGS